LRAVFCWGILIFHRHLRDTLRNQGESILRNQLWPLRLTTLAVVASLAFPANFPALADSPEDTPARRRQRLLPIR